MDFTTGLNKRDINKLNLYVDIDGVVLRTSEAFINHYCKEHNINKTFYDLKDYNLRSIDKNIKLQDFFRYVETKDFINEVEFFEDFVEYYKKRKNDFNWIFITKGTLNFFNIKQKLLEKKLGYDIEFIHISPNQEKNIVDMTNGIQIDDFYWNLDTNAKIKILVKNFIDTDYNFVPDIRDDLYIVNDWKDIGSCLDWFKYEWDLENNFENYV